MPEHGELTPIEAPSKECTSDIVRTLVCGGKQLDITLPQPGFPVASSYIRNIDGEVRTSGATTALYREAAKILQHHADLMGIEVMYIFRTQSEKMEDWAYEIGSDIFEWTIDDDGWVFQAKAFFTPRND